MIKLLLAAAAFSTLLSACVAPSNEPLRVESNTQNQPNAPTNPNEASARPIEKSMNALNITKLEVSRAAQATLQLENSSKAPLRIWRDSNSWGAACWRVFLIRNGSLEVFFQNPDQEFTRNGPAFNEIPGGGHQDQKLDLNGGNWCGMGHCSIHSERGLGGKTMTFEPNDTVIVIYDVPVTQEARDQGVWYGVVAASTTVQ
jgi:post-segregation antitoxin (ccd killing protein)